MVKHTQPIRRQHPTNCLERLVLKVLNACSLQLCSSVQTKLTAIVKNNGEVTCRTNIAVSSSFFLRIRTQEK